MYISDTDLFGHTCSLCCRPFDCQFSLVFATGVSDDWAFLGGLGRRAGGHWWRASWAPAARPAGRVCCWWHDSENCRGNRLEKFKTADRHCRRGSRASLKPIVYDACGLIGHLKACMTEIFTYILMRAWPIRNYHTATLSSPSCLAPLPATVA